MTPWRNKTTAARFIVPAVVVFVTVFYFFADPLTARFMPQCVFYKLTGLKCVGCGSQRMLHAILHGDFYGAFQANALAFISLPFIAFLLWLETRRNKYRRLYARIYTKAFIVVVVVIFAGWFILRNWILEDA